MIRKILILALSSLISAAASYGWDLIDNFDDYADQAALDEVWNFLEDDTEGEGGGGLLMDDPYVSENKVLQVNQGMTTAETGSYNTRVYRSIPDVGPTGVTTVYWRFAVPSVLDGEVEVDGVVDTVMGLSPVADPSQYSDYSPMFRQEFDGSLDFYNLDTYTLILETLPGSTWYEVWMVQDTDNRTYDAYILGGEAYPAKTQIVDDFGWRNQTLEALTTIVMTTSAGTLVDPKGLDAVLIDDIYMTAGEDITSPLSPWIAVDTFEDYADQAALDAVWDFLEDDTEGEGGGGVLAEDPYSAGNMVLQVNQGMTTAETGSYNTRVYRSIPDVGPTGMATVYWRFAVPSVLDGEVEVDGVVDTVMGLSPVADPSQYSDYSPMFRQEFDGSLDFYNLDTYTLILETLPGSTWYEVWLVQDTDNRTYDAYIKGGLTYLERTQIADDFGWRNQTLEALTTIVMTTSAGTLVDPKGLDAVLIDDIYMAPGQELTNPVGGTANDPLIGGTPVPNLPGWYLSGWFGFYNTTFQPWLFHAEHGWLYRDAPSSSESGMYLYDDAMVAWWYTSQTDYPSLYAFNPPADLGGTDIESAWLWYFEGTKTPRSFSVLTGPDAGKFLTYNP